MCAQDSRRGSTRSSFTRIEARPNLRCTRRRFPARVSAHVKPWCSRVGVDWSRLTRWCLAILLPHPVSMGQSPASQAALSPLIHWLSGPRRAPGQSGDSGTPRAQTRPGNERSHAVRSAARSTAALRPTRVTAVYSNGYATTRTDVRQGRRRWAARSRVRRIRAKSGARPR